MSKTAEILGGYILLSRQLLNSDIWRKPPHYLKIWVWMLMTAHWADGDFERGQLCTSYAELQELGVHKSGNRTEGRFTTDQVRSAISWLVETGAIKTEKTRHGLMITIQNYNEYQNPANYVAGGNSGHQPGTTPDPGPDPTHKQAQHIDSAIKNKLKANPGTGPETTPETSRTPHLYIDNNEKDIPSNFSAFYSVYPKKKNRADAERAFAKLNPSAELFSKMMAALAWQTKQPDWVKDGGQYVPLPASWLNKRRWEDEKPLAQATRPRIELAI